VRISQELGASLCLGETSMPETVNQNRRRMLAAAAMSIAAAQFPDMAAMKK
jgi:hypothetical protein